MNTGTDTHTLYTYAFVSLYEHTLHMHMQHTHVYT